MTVAKSTETNQKVEYGLAEFSPSTNGPNWRGKVKFPSVISTGTNTSPMMTNQLRYGMPSVHALSPRSTFIDRPSDQK